jgi:hypothetical protein
MAVELVTKSEFARRQGISPSRVTHLCKSIINKALVNKGGKEVLNYKKAVKLYEAGSDPNFIKGSPQIKNAGDGGGNGQGSTGDSFLTWRTHNERYKAAASKLKYEREKGEYVERKKVYQENFSIARILRDSLMNMPGRCAAMVAAKSKKKEKEIYQILMFEVRRSIEDCIKDLKIIGGGK